MKPLVGRDRCLIVDELFVAFDECVRDASPQLVCLEAEAGWGKTRIVQELYSRLQQERQPPPGYWPRELVEGPVEDPMQARKLVYPTAAPDPEADLPWFWWGLRCDEDSSGRKVRAVVNERVQIMEHLDGFIQAAQRRLATKEVALAALGEVIALVPGVGQVVSLTTTLSSQLPNLKRALSGLGGRGQARSAESDMGTIDEAERAARAVTAELELVRQFVSPELPLILVVDDAHHADSTTVAFARAVMAMSKPILLVATGWPSALAVQAEKEQELDPQSRLTFGGMLSSAIENMAGQARRVPLAPLQDEALEQIVLDAAPKTSEEIRSELLHVSDGNPLVLELQLGSRRVIESIQDEAITLDPGEVAGLPRSFVRLIEERFFDLGTTSQRWLAEAADQGTYFFSDFLSSTPVHADRLNAFVRLRSDGPVPFGSFIERPVHQAVVSAAEAEFSKAERIDWRKAALEKLQRHWAEESPLTPADDAVQARFCELPVRLAEELEEHGMIPLDGRALCEAALGWSYAERELGRVEAEQAAAAAAKRWSVVPQAGLLQEVRAAIRLSGFARTQGDVDAAVSEARAAVEMCERKDAGPERQVAWIMLAEALRQTGDVKAAREAITTAAETPGEDFVWAFEVLSFVERERGDNDAVLAALDRAIEAARAEDPVDLENLLELEMQQAMRGIPALDRWRAHAEMAAARFGTGSRLHREALEGVVLSLLSQGADGGEIQSVMTEIEALPDQPDDSPAPSFLPMLQAAIAGDAARAGQELNALAEAAPPNPRMSATVAALSRAMQGEPPTSEEAELADPYVAALELARSDPEEGLQRLAELIGGSRVIPVMGVQLAMLLLGEWLVARGVPHDLSPKIMGAIQNAPREGGTWAEASRAVSDYEDALAILQGDAVEDREPAWSPAIELKAACMRAVAWSGAGNFAEMVPELERARSLAASIGTYMAFRAVALAHGTCKQDDAVRLWEAAGSAPDATPPRRLSAQGGLAAYYSKRGRHQEALPLQKLVLEGLHGLVEDDSPKLTKARAQLAETYGSLHRWEDAVPLWAEVLKARRERYGDEGSSTAEARSALEVARREAERSH